MDLRELAHAERTDLAALLDTLTPEQWDTPSLCAGWRVRDVVAHIISYDGLTVPALVTRLARGWFLPSRANAAGVAAARTRTPAELVAQLRAHLWPTGLATGFGGMIAITDGLIHHQDIRRPLGLPRQIPPDRLLAALRGALVAPPVGGFWRARGLRVVATDLDYASGRGPEVRGPGEALMMAVAGRPGVVGELDGPGQAILAGRISPAEPR